MWRNESKPNCFDDAVQKKASSNARLFYFKNSNGFYKVADDNDILLAFGVGRMIDEIVIIFMLTSM